MRSVDLVMKRDYNGLESVEDGIKWKRMRWDGMG